MTDAELLELARWWIEERVPVLFVRLSRDADGVTTKRPAATAHGFQDATLDLDELEKTLDAARAEQRDDEVLGVAGVPGRAGFAVGDFDTKRGAAGAATLEQLLGEYADAAICRYRSISGALNCIWRKPAGCPALGNATVAGWHGFELRCDAGYVVLPGTFTPWGAWHFEEASLELAEAWTLTLELVNRFRAAGAGRRTATSPEVENYIAQRTRPAPETRELVEEILEEFHDASQHGRHPALVRAVGRLIGLDRIDLGAVLERLQQSWDAATAGEGREREVQQVVAWTIGQERARRRSFHYAPKPRDDELEEEELSLDVVQALPMEFWEPTYLRRVYDCAKQRYLTPEAFLADLLVELLARIPPNVVLPDLIGTFAALNLYVATIAASGLGKSTSASAARDVFVVAGEKKEDAPPRLPIGSGQGIAESYLIPDPANTKGPKILRPDPSIIFTMDEGEQLLRLASDPKSTTLTTIRMAWNGAEIGAANANRETRRVIARRCYRLGLVVNFTPASAAKLLAEADVGTPQRFLFVNAQDFTMERREGNVRSTIKWTPPPEVPKGKQQEIILPPRVRREIEDAHIERHQRHSHPEKDYDAHRLLLQEKVATPILLLDDTRAKRYAMSYEDWERGAMFVDYCARVRDLELAMVKRKQQRDAHAKQNASAALRVTENRALVADLVRECVAQIEQIVASAGEISPQKVRDALGKRLRAVAPDGFREVLERGSVHERDVRTKAGRTKRVLVWSEQ